MEFHASWEYDGSLPALLPPLHCIALTLTIFLILCELTCLFLFSALLTYYLFVTRITSVRVRIFDLFLDKSQVPTIMSGM